MARAFKGYTGITKKLLSRGEGSDVDYKEILKGLTSDDLVAFANSELGGTILVGVKESIREDGSMFGLPIGHAIGDGVEHQIRNKASQCVPAIKVSISFEGTSEKPIVRIKIPSGDSKPYCTNKGTYKIRDGNMNAAIHPPKLLQMFIVSETEIFTERFQENTRNLEKMTAGIYKLIDNLESTVGSKIDDIDSSMMMAEWEASDASSAASNVLSIVSNLQKEAVENRKRVKAFLDKSDAEDPLKPYQRQQIRNAFVTHFNKASHSEATHDELKDLLSKKTSLSFPDDKLPDALTQNDVEEIYQEVLDEVGEYLKRNSTEEE